MLLVAVVITHNYPYIVDMAGVEPASLIISLLVSTLLVSCIHTTDKVIRFVGVRWDTIISLLIRVANTLSKHDLARYHLGDKAW